MNTEQKAKAYDEALKRARECHVDGLSLHQPVKDVLEYIFHELKESEDEKIRKLLIEAVIQVLQDQYCSNRGVSKEKVVAWLEKQGKESSWKPSKEEMDVLYGLAYITNQYDKHKEEVITRLYQDLKREFFNGSSYENMFPTNTSTEDDVRRRSTIQVLEYARSLDAYNQYGKADIDKNIAWLEKQGKKETLCDKCRKEHPSHSCQDITALGRCALEKQDEQKVSVVDFKAKDWYVSKVDGKIYNAKFMGKTPTNQARKLEIEKAAMSTTGIIEQEEWFIKGAEWSDKNPSYICSEKQNEQKPTDKVEPKFKVKYAGNEYNVLDIKENMGMTWYGIEDEPNHIDYVKANSCEIINVYGIKENGSPYPTKPAIFAGHNPSDEDMKEALRTEYEKGRADAISEMKSSWSEEDEDAIGMAIIALEDMYDEDAPNTTYGGYNLPFNKAAERLKSLKDRYTWKPSDEQLKSLQEVIDVGHFTSYPNSLETLYEQLKKLR